ncbi:MAG: DUF1080 domain-containing protein [Planctomycetia bacterium]|nr:DUF1080 domain-containing protein [Planctomycetia bacterium]
MNTLLLWAVFSWTLPSAGQVAEGWIALFDGETTFGWTVSDGEWAVENGTLVGTGGAMVLNTRFPKATWTYEVNDGSGWKAFSFETEAVGKIVIRAWEGKRTAFRNIFLKPQGLKPLFHGENLEGWNLYPEMPGRFTVDKAMRCIVVKDGPGMLESKESFGDFVLQVAAKTGAEHLNSGIFFRCIPGEKMNGYESQIHNGVKDGDRTQPLDAGTGAIFRRTVARYVPANDKEIFYKTIVADGAHIAVWVNGLQVTDWTDTRKPNANPRRGLRLEPGTLMLQAHDPTTDVYFYSLNIGEIR